MRARVRVETSRLPLRRFYLSCGAALILLLCAAWAFGKPPSHRELNRSRAPSAATVARLAPIVVSGVGYGVTGFNLPSSIYFVSGKGIHQAAQQVNLTETLQRIPGLYLQNRYDYAQDVQLSIRGFGAVAPFGVQGIRLIVDGIPATMPDGQGETQLFDLPTLERIVVLEGPFSAMYGNAAGGVILGYTKNGPSHPTVQLGGWAGSYGSHQETLQGGGQFGIINIYGGRTTFSTDGYRNHSAAYRANNNFKMSLAPWHGGHVEFVANVFSQNADDPSGLTALQMAENPRQVRSAIYTYDARKYIHNSQAGITLSQVVNRFNRLHVSSYVGTRRIQQFLPFSGDFGLSAGGVVALHDFFGGGKAYWSHSGRLDGAPYDFALGLGYQRENEFRKGYVNADGIAGQLRNDQYNVVYSFDQFFQGHLHFAPHWAVSAGVRKSKVTFRSTDVFTPGTPPSGVQSRSYTSTTPVVGISYTWKQGIMTYADYGRGFETPTFYQLAYRPNGAPGLNFSLLPSYSNNYELGTRIFDGALTFDSSIYHIFTQNAIIVDQSAGGRTSYKNAGQVNRNGFELSARWDAPNHVILSAAYSYLSATYGGGSPYDGQTLPGIPRNRLYLGARWAPGIDGIYTKLDMVAQSRMYANSHDTAFAAGYLRLDWAIGLKQSLTQWKFSEFFRVNNVLDRNYVGALVIGDEFGRYYEPAPGRNYVFGIKVSRRF